MASFGDGEPATLSPTDAFELLGNETRLQILGVLAAADGPMSFTELRDDVGVPRGAQFNYHLDKIVGQFVDKTEEGYSLRLPGSRVVQAVLSTAVTPDSTIDPTQLKETCYHCGAPILLTYGGNHVAVFCTECHGNYYLRSPDLIEQIDIDEDTERIGFLGGFELPPAGVIDRSETELLRAGVAWQNLERQAVGIGMCPRCSATVDTSVDVCEIHDDSDGVCGACHHRYAIQLQRVCSNCNYNRYGQLARVLPATPELLNFITSHGINPINPGAPIEFMGFLDDYEEEVVSVEPFEGRFTFAIGADAVTLTVDDDLTVVEVERGLQSDT